MTTHIDTVIVGGGQGGLATSHFLAQQGRKHIILERAPQAASAWRQRWESFALNTPNWMIRLPGAEYQANFPDGFMIRDDVIAYFESYIARFELPITYDVQVTSVEPLDNRYLVNTDKSAYSASNVVIATGLFQQPRIPSFSANLSPEIRQLHSGDYLNPEALPRGAVLVVGSAQSGCQIAEELNLAGRKVYLSVGKAGRLPRRYRGRDITWWLDKIGFFDREVDKLPSPDIKFAGSVHVTGINGGHTINLHQFARDGIVLLGRVQNGQGNQIHLAGDLKENLTNIDKGEVEILSQIDEFIEKNNPDLPVESLVKMQDGYAAEEITELDLMSVGVTSIVWASGYKFDFSMVKLPVFELDGYPVQKRGVTEFPGLYFIGLPFLHTVKSGLLAGVSGDAAHVAEHINCRN